MNTATIATSTVAAPISTGLAASCRRPSLMAPAGSRGGRSWTGPQARPRRPGGRRASGSWPAARGAPAAGVAAPVVVAAGAALLADAAAVGSGVVTPGWLGPRYWLPHLRWPSLGLLT